MVLDENLAVADLFGVFRRDLTMAFDWQPSTCRRPNDFAIISLWGRKSNDIH